MVLRGVRPSSSMVTCVIACVVALLLMPQSLLAQRGNETSSKQRTTDGSSQAAPRSLASQERPTLDVADEENCEDGEDKTGTDTLRPETSLAPTLSTSARKQTLSPELMRTVLEVAREVDPALAKRLRRMQERDQEGFMRAMSTTGRRWLALAELKSKDRKLYGFKLGELKTERRVRLLAERVKIARRQNSADQISLEEELRTNIQVLLAYSMATRLRYLERLKEEIDREADRFDEAVDDRLEQLLGEPVLVEKN